MSKQLSYKDIGIARLHAYIDDDVITSQRKIVLLKRRLKKGAKIGPYKVISCYPHHCLVKNEYGYNECFSYLYLSKYINTKEGV